MADKQQEKNEGEKQFSIQPIKDSIESKASAFSAHPGPAVTKDMPKEEGTKEERQAKKQDLNK